MSLELRLLAPDRGVDDYGAGNFGASRDGGGRQHLGHDYAAWPGSIVLPFCGGEVTKVGYPYGDDLSWRYVRILAPNGWIWRYFYVEPLVKKGEEVTVDTPIGKVQDLRKRYGGELSRRGPITPHVHVDVRDDKGQWLDPEKL